VQNTKPYSPIIHDEKLVEREPTGTWDLDRRVDAINPVSDFMHIRSGLPVRDYHRRFLSTNNVICPVTVALPNGELTGREKRQLFPVRVQ